MPNYYLNLPLEFLSFWYLKAPVRLIKFFMDVNHSIIQLLSLTILIKTFFRPIKNEYRKGLIGFSIGMGIVVKSSLIFVDLILLGFVFFLEILIFTFFVWWPFITLTFFFI